eukprot:4139169-Karenia_brevis.AAC.1
MTQSQRARQQSTLRAVGLGIQMANWMQGLHERGMATKHMACGRDEDALSAQLVKVILANAMYKGSDVRLATGTMLRPDTWPRKSLMPWWWR